MEILEYDLNELIKKGKSQGYLTYAEVTNYLPDEANWRRKTGQPDRGVGGFWN